MSRVLGTPTSVPTVARLGMGRLGPSPRTDLSVSPEKKGRSHMATANDAPHQRASVEFVTLANHAECANGLLYLSGAGFDQLYRPSAPEGQEPTVHFGIAVSVLVPWTETNRKHRVVITIIDDDGHSLIQGDGELEVGRPPGTPPGSDLRAALAINFSMPCPKHGGYRVTAELGGRGKSVHFRVVDRPELRRAG